MGKEEDFKKYSKEIKKAEDEYKELQEIYKGKIFEEQHSNKDITIVIRAKDNFKGYYKSLTYVVRDEEGKCKLSKTVDIYDSKGNLIIGNYQIVK